MRKIALLAGDGIGPEISSATRRVLEVVSDHFDLDLSFQEVVIGFDAFETFGSTFPDQVIDEIEECSGIILGPVSRSEYPPREEGGLIPSCELRKRLDLFANIRPALSRAGIPPRAGVPLDLVVVRENTEGFLADRNLHEGHGEVMVTEDVSLSLRRITRCASLRIAQEAFRIARARRSRVTAVHKANVMRTTCGLFLDCCRKVAAQNPDILYHEELVDAMCAHLVRAPDKHDVIVTTNLFGDILSDLASELSGSLSLAASLNAGENQAMAQAQHGSAPDLAGEDVANPASLIGSSAMLLDWMGRRQDSSDLRNAAKAIDAALETVLSKPEQRTRDLGGKNGTKGFTDAVIRELPACAA